MSPSRKLKLLALGTSLLFGTLFGTVRNRVLYVALACLVVALGLATRRYTDLLPPVVVRYAGDTLWATLVFLALGCFAPRWSSLRIGAVALLVSYSVEVSQLYHAPWIDAIRRTQLGGLTLGFGFLWSDLACYTVGIGLGLVVDRGLQKALKKR
jgi:hypothetical protein